MTTAPGGSVDAEFLDPAYATTPCDECAVEVPHAAMADHRVTVHGHTAT